MEPGNKVVCIDDSPCKVCGRILEIVKGKVYVVRGIRMNNVTPTLILDLVGLYPECHGAPNPGYSIKRFRLLDEIKASLQTRAGRTAP